MINTDLDEFFNEVEKTKLHLKYVVDDFVIDDMEYDGMDFELGSPMKKEKFIPIIKVVDTKEKSKKKGLF